jgi:putative dehydrogenase
VSPAAIEEFVTAGGRGASTPAQAVVGADLVVSVVVSGALTEAVPFGERGAAAAIPEGAFFASSTAPGQSA